MIKEFVKVWDEHKGELEEIFKEKHPDDYTEIVTNVIKLINTHADVKMDIKRIYRIANGNRRGAELYIIPEDGYPIYKYWYVKVEYGTCSGCDTLKGIRAYEYGIPSERKLKII